MKHGYMDNKESGVLSDTGYTHDKDVLSKTAVEKLLIGEDEMIQSYLNALLIPQNGQSYLADGSYSIGELRFSEHLIPSTSQIGITRKGICQGKYYQKI